MCWLFAWRLKHNFKIASFPNYLTNSKNIPGGITDEEDWVPDGKDHINNNVTKHT